MFLHLKNYNPLSENIEDIAMLNLEEEKKYIHGLFTSKLKYN